MQERNAGSFAPRRQDKNVGDLTTIDHDENTDGKGVHGEANKHALEPQP